MQTSSSLKIASNIRCLEFGCTKNRYRQRHYEAILRFDHNLPPSNVFVGLDDAVRNTLKPLVIRPEKHLVEYQPITSPDEIF